MSKWTHIVGIIRIDQIPIKGTIEWLRQIPIKLRQQQALIRQAVANIEVEDSKNIVAVWDGSWLFKITENR